MYRIALCACATLIVLLEGSLSRAQPGMVSGWTVELLDVNPNAAGVELANMTVAEQYAAGEVDPSTFGVNAGASRIVNAVDFAGESGSYDIDHPYPHGIPDSSADQFVMWATAEVFIPEGWWSVAFGSYDGGQVTIEGVNFDDPLFPRWEHTADGDGNDDPNRIRHEGAREADQYGFTGGHFQVGSGGLETTITAMMYDQEGKDAFEVVVRDNSDFLYNERPQDNFGLDPTFDFLWEPLADGSYGWELKTTEMEGYVAVAGRDNVGRFELPSGSSLLTDVPYELEVDAAAKEADLLAVRDPSGEMDISGATLQVNVTGEPQDGDVFQLVQAGTIVGQPTLAFPDGGDDWDTDNFATTGLITYSPAAATLPTDFDGDGDVDAVDMTTLILAWTGPDAGAATEGDTDGDQDVDAVDLTNVILSWTGVSANVSPDPPDSSRVTLEYDPATGEVTLRAPENNPDMRLVTFVIENPDGQLTKMDGTKFPFLSAVEQVQNNSRQIGITDLTLQGKELPLALGKVLPEGIADAEALSEFLPVAKGGTLGKGGRFNFAVVPEPGGLVMSLLAGLLLCGMRRIPLARRVRTPWV